MEVVREMNRLGMIVDVAHASSDMTKKVADVTTKPLILSHTRLRREPREYTRAILADHARAVAETGGVIGVWPAGEGPLVEWIYRFRRLSDVVGVEHVGVGTDMGGLRRTRFDNYKELPALVEGLLDGGYSKAEVAQILGGNFMRVFRTVAG